MHHQRDSLAPPTNRTAVQNPPDIIIRGGRPYVVSAPTIICSFLQQHPYFLYEIFDSYLKYYDDYLKYYDDTINKLVGCKHLASEGVFYIQGCGFVCQIIMKISLPWFYKMSERRQRKHER